jgi:nuclear export mediator factor NEMF
MKFIMNNHDLMAIVAEIKSLGECRLNNIYDVEGRFISLKIKTKDKQNKFIMVDAGKKFYISNDKIENDRKLPSSFIMKLRKHLENKLILNIKQINYDRVIDISFGYTEIQYHLIIEMYASGNIIFTDENYKILTLTNTHIYKEKKEDNDKTQEQKKDNYKDKDKNNKKEKDKKDDNEEKTFVKVNEIYPLNKSVVDISVYNITSVQFKEWYNNFSDENKNTYSIKKLLLGSPLIYFGKENIENSLLELDIDIKKPINLDQLDKIINQIRKNHIINSGSQGYIILEGEKPDTYTPILYQQHKNKKVISFNSFSKTIEEFYKLTTNSTKKTDQKEGKKKKENDKDLQKILNIKNQIKKMQNKYNDVTKKIQLLEENVELINTVMIYINSYTGDNFDEHLKNMNSSLKKHDLNVQIIFENSNRVNIQNKKIKLTFKNNIYIIDPKHMAYDHISVMYKDNKTSTKKIKTTQQMLDENEKKYQEIQKLKEKEKLKAELKEEILKEMQQKEQNEEQKDQDETENISQKSSIGKRKVLWYEQFHWFISSEGLIVIVGKSADQNEMLVKRYMENHDLYMHSDVHGSGSCIIKRNPNDKDIPYMTLEEANTFLICHTKAWSANSPDKSYWVYPNQVSKTPKTGEYVTKGSFIITGTKNYMTIPRLELGLTIMFKNKNSEILSNKVSDETQFAIPMCAPYRLVNKNKLKVKIIPGNKSINKTIKNDILSTIKKQMTPKESAFIKEITNDDYQKVLVPNMKILG